MKRIINKLLKKLFGLKLVRTKEYQHLLDAFELTKKGIMRYGVYWSSLAGQPCYEVKGFSTDSNAFVIIKRFLYEVGNPEDRNYMQLCAQELCDKLNEEVLSCLCG